MTLSEKQKYLVSELWILAWNASVQHAGLYNDGVKRDGTDKRIAVFKTALIGFITETLLPHYLEKCTTETQEALREELHYKNIAELIQFAGENDPGILREHGYKYGVAQKLLNLILKYLWCADIISTPPHCPVDRIVIEKTKFRGKLNWTQILEESEYREIIETIKQLAKAQQMSASEWELDCYKRRRLTS
jgi:hypothetical protein